MRTDDIFYDKDADLSKLEGKTVAILGYGSQGHAHALNLKDSGVDVVVGLRPDSSSRAKAESAGLEVLDIADAASRGDAVMILLPDEKQAEVWEAEIADGIAPGNLLLFAHGFAIHFEQIVPPPGVDIGMVAPKGPGHLVRRQFVDGKGVPCLMAVAQGLNLPVLPELTVQLQLRVSTPELGYDPAIQLILRGGEFTALVCYDDIAAIGAIRAFMDRGLRVPKDISVVGFDDIQGAAFHNPSLTTIRQPLQQMGTVAARILLQRIRGEGTFPESVSIHPDLVIRESTCPPIDRRAHGKRG